MYFEILGEIAEVETFATGPASASSPAFESSMDVVGGGSARGSLAFDWQMAQFK
jgi:hypothetical protein